MTTLAAIQGEGWCAIAADSQVSDETGFTMEIVTGKVFSSGPALIAAAGSVRGINILQFAWTAPACTTKSTDVYMTKTFIPAMRRAFIENGYDMKSDGDVASNENEFLIAVKGVLYSVDDDYSWERCSRHLYAGGSGANYALGALSVLGAEKSKSIEDASRFLRKAVATSIKYDAYSGGDITVFSQEA